MTVLKNTRSQEELEELFEINIRGKNVEPTKLLKSQIPQIPLPKNFSATHIQSLQSLDFYEINQFFNLAYNVKFMGWTEQKKNKYILFSYNSQLYKYKVEINHKNCEFLNNYLNPEQKIHFK